MKRKKMTRKFSNRVARNGQKTEVKNLRAIPMRGGYRL